MTLIIFMLFSEQARRHHVGDPWSTLFNKLLELSFCHWNPNVFSKCL